MKLSDINIYHPKAFVVCAVLAFTLSACDEDDANVIPYEPGNRLVITGPSTVNVGDEGVRFFVKNNRQDADYNWTVGSGATFSELPENDAFVNVDFNTAGTQTVSVTKDGATGEKTVDVVSREVGFTTDTVQVMETIANDTLTIPLDIAGGFRGNVDVNYEVLNLDPSRFSIVEGFESPLSVTSADEAEIKIVLFPDEEVVEGENLLVRINSVTPALANEYVVSESDSIVFQITSDLKVASLDPATINVTGAGAYTIPVTLSNPSAEKISITYSITPPMSLGVTDATPTDVQGILEFAPGEMEKEIVVSISPLAFTNDKIITVSLDNIVTGDAEASIDPEGNTKQLVIDVEE